MARKVVNLIYCHEKKQTLPGFGKCLRLIVSFMKCFITLRNHLITGNTSFIFLLMLVNASPLIVSLSYRNLITHPLIEGISPMTSVSYVLSTSCCLFPACGLHVL